jgi:hypothetical protein
LESQKNWCLEASTKPHAHQKFEIFWTNIASTMACPNFKNWAKKMDFVRQELIVPQVELDPNMIELT